MSPLTTKNRPGGRKFDTLGIYIYIKYTIYVKRHKSRRYTLPPIIMEVEHRALEDEWLLSKRIIFHFYDSCGKNIYIDLHLSCKEKNKCRYIQMHSMDPMAILPKPNRPGVDQSQHAHQTKQAKPHHT